MPKNAKKKKNSKNKGGPVVEKILLEKEPGQEYALVIKLLGDARVRLKCYDGKDRLGIIRGKMRKRVWIKENDLVLLALREFDDERGDVIHKYDDNETRKLKKMGELIDSNGQDFDTAHMDEKEEEDNEDDYWSFEDI